MSQDRSMSEDIAVHADVQAKIGDKLKEVYSDVMSEPVPDRFLELLQQLESGSATMTNGSDGNHE